MKTSIIETKRMVNLFLKNPTQENFNTLQYDKLALSLVYRKIQNKKELTDFLLTFNEDALKNLYYGVFGGLKIAIAQAISEYDKTLEQWVSLYFYSFGELKQLALIKIKGVNDYSFDGWENMLTKLEKFNKSEFVGNLFSKLTDEESEKLRSVILSKMAERAKTIYHWGVMYKNSDGNLKATAFDKLEQMM